MYLYVQVYALGCVIWTDCTGLDFHKFSIVSNDYLNDSHVPNGLNWYNVCELENNK